MTRKVVKVKTTSAKEHQVLAGLCNRMNAIKHLLHFVGAAILCMLFMVDGVSLSGQSDLISYPLSLPIQSHL